MAATLAPVSRDLFPPDEATAPIDLSRTALPAPLRRAAELSVLDITEFFGRTSGGIRTYLLQKAQYVEERDHLSQVLVVPGAHDTISQTEGVRAYQLAGPRVPKAAPYRFMLATRSPRRIVEHERPDVIEIGSPFTVPWIVNYATRRLDIPLVYFYHSNFPRIMCPFPERAASPMRAIHELGWQYAKKLDKLFEMTFVSSQFAADDLKRAGIDRVTNIPLGADLDHFHPRRREYAAETRRLFGLPVDAPLAAYFGRFAREKEIDVAIDAWPEIERRTGAYLLLVGDGPAKAYFESRVKSDRVLWLPYQSDRERLADLLAALDLYIAPGPVETFGLSALEALASGTPVLTVNRGGVSEQIAASGAGAHYEAGKPASCAREAIRLLAADLPELGARGRAYAEANHSWPTVFDRIFEVYRGIRRG